MPFDTHGTHHDASSKIDMELEIKNFKAVGEILAEIWSELIIDGHPIKAAYIDPQPDQKDGKEFM